MTTPRIESEFRPDVHTEDRDSLFREFCRAAVEHGGFRLAWIGLVDRASDLLNMAASHGATGYLDGIRISVNEDASQCAILTTVLNSGSRSEMRHSQNPVIRTCIVSC